MCLVEEVTAAAGPKDGAIELLRCSLRGKSLAQLGTVADVLLDQLVNRNIEHVVLYRDVCTRGIHV